MYVYVYVWGKETQDKKGKLLAEILKSGAQGINNMYNTAEEIGQEGREWECPLCGKRGDRIGIFGVCKHSPCRGVRTEGTFRDRAATRKRKVETVLIGDQYKLQDGRSTRVFWSDGSEQDITQGGAQDTAWGLVECSQTQQEDGTITIRKKEVWMGGANA